MSKCCITVQVAAQASGRPGSSAAPGQYSKYGLDAPQSASSGMAAKAEDTEEYDEEPNGTHGVEQTNGSAPRRHMSAAERRAHRKVGAYQSSCKCHRDQALGNLILLGRATDCEIARDPVAPFGAQCVHMLLSQGTDADANGASAAGPPKAPELEAARKAEGERRAGKVGSIPCQDQTFYLRGVP